MRVDLVKIFPDYFAPLGLSLLGRARERGLLDVHIHDLRGWTDDVHRSVDDAPYGGGPGMVMRPEPWGRALDAIRAAADRPAGAMPRLVLPTPGGRLFTQATAAEYAAQSWLVIACGRYEGIDARVALDAASVMTVDEVSVGDYVLAGGEAAALIILEATARLLPGFMGNAASVRDESFGADGSLDTVEGPAFTRPASWRGLDVPAVLRSGDHAAVARWRREQARRRTLAVRPDLDAGQDADD
jgi:tRNA (guanine37-N1)-methyltransferase